MRQPAMRLRVADPEDGGHGLPAGRRGEWVSVCVWGGGGGGGYWPLYGGGPADSH